MQLLRDRFFIAIAAILLVGGYHTVATYRLRSLKGEVAVLRAKVKRLEASGSSAAYLNFPVAPRRIPAFLTPPRRLHRIGWRVPLRVPPEDMLFAAPAGLLR
jgi:hypothetical protein